MINYDEAKNIARQYFLQNNNEPLVRALETNEFWIFFGGYEGRIEYGGEGVKISKLSGDISDFFLPDDKNFELLDKAKKIKL